MKKTAEVRSFCPRTKLSIWDKYTPDFGAFSAQQIGNRFAFRDQFIRGCSNSTLSKLVVLHSLDNRPSAVFNGHRVGVDKAFLYTIGAI